MAGTEFWNPGVLIPSRDLDGHTLLGLALGLGCSLAWGWTVWSISKRWGRAACPAELRQDLQPETPLIWSVIALTGPLMAGWLALLALLAGARLAAWWPAALLGAGLVAVALARRRRFPDGRPPTVLAASDPDSLLRRINPFPWFILLPGIVGLVLGLTLPTTDYDGLAIWSYRTRVLLEERTFYTPSLLDTLRLVPMREHPYLLPASESLWCVAGGGFSWLGQRAPHAVMVVGWLMLSLTAWRPLGLDPSWRWIVAAALAALSSAVLGPWMESAREPIIGMLLGLGTLYFVEWLRRPAWPTALFVAAFSTVLAQQIKVEGSAGLAGFVPAVVLAWLVEKRGSVERRLRWSALWRAFLLIGVMALPWALMHRVLAEGGVGYDLTTGMSSGWQERKDGFLIVFWLTVTEVGARPEIYGFALPLALMTVLSLLWRNGLVWNWRCWVRAACPFLPVLTVLVAVGLVYVVRQEQLPMERNLTYSRRIYAVMPGLIVALLALPSLLGRNLGPNPLQSTGEPARPPS